MNMQQTSLTARHKFNHNQKTHNEFRSSNGIKSNLDEDNYQEIKRNFETSIHHKREKQKHYEMKLIEIKKRKLELKRKTFDDETVKKKEIKFKENQNEKVKNNISTLNSEINEIVKELKTHKEKEINLITQNKEKYLNKINEKIFELKEIRRQIRKRKENEKEKRENEIMLEEEISQTKKQLLNSTSKMESHIELMLNIEQGSRKICPLILTPKSNLEFINDISIDQYNTLDKLKLWNLIFEKIKNFNEKNSFSVNDSKDELSFSDLNKKEYFQEEKEKFVKRMISLEAGENSNTQLKSSQMKRSSKNEKIYYNFNELIQLFLKEILSENEIQFKNIQTESDLKIILLSHIKLFIYEDLITSSMSHLNSLKQNSDRKISNHNKEICDLYSKIKKKIKKIKICKEKLKFITNEEKSLNQEGELNLLNIRSMENDIETMNKLQIQNEIELDIMKNELRSARDRHEDKSSYYKIKKKKLKEKIKKLEESIEEKMSKFDNEPVVDLCNKVNRHLDKAKENKYDYDGLDPGNSNYNYDYDYNQDSGNLPSNKSAIYNSSKNLYKNYQDYSDYSRTFSGKEKAFSLTANFNSNFTPDKNIKREKSGDDKGNLNSITNDNKKKFYSYTNSNFYTGRNPNQTHLNEFGVNNNFNTDLNKNKLGFELYYDHNSNQRTKHEFSFLDKIRPLLLGNTVYKRYFVNINKKQTSENSAFNPVDFINGKINLPEDSNFLKSFLCIDKSISKLLFNKLKEDDKSFEINLTSISKIVVPKITKDVIFLKQIYKKINMKKNKISDTNSYIEKNLGILVQMYHSGIKSELAEIDEKLFDEEYRSLLLKSNKYMLYIYLKPDEETRIELIFNDYEDFKHWINGMENILKNKEVKDFIKKRI